MLLLLKSLLSLLEIIFLNLPYLLKIRYCVCSYRDKVKCELRIASCELQVASCELRVASCKLRVAKAYTYNYFQHLKLPFSYMIYLIAQLL